MSDKLLKNIQQINKRSNSLLEKYSSTILEDVKHKKEAEIVETNKTLQSYYKSLNELKNDYLKSYNELKKNFNRLVRDYDGLEDQELKALNYKKFNKDLNKLKENFVDDIFLELQRKSNKSDTEQAKKISDLDKKLRDTLKKNPNTPQKIKIAGQYQDINLKKEIDALFSEFKLKYYAYAAGLGFTAGAGYFAIDYFGTQHSEDLPWVSEEEESTEVESESNSPELDNGNDGQNPDNGDGLEDPIDVPGDGGGDDASATITEEVVTDIAVDSLAFALTVAGVAIIAFKILALASYLAKKYEKTNSLGNTVVSAVEYEKLHGKEHSLKKLTERSEILEGICKEIDRLQSKINQTLGEESKDKDLDIEEVKPNKAKAESKFSVDDLVKDGSKATDEGFQAMLAEKAKKSAAAEKSLTPG